MNQDEVMIYQPLYANPWSGLSWRTLTETVRVREECVCVYTETSVPSFRRDGAGCSPGGTEKFGRPAFSQAHLNLLLRSPA